MFSRFAVTLEIEERVHVPSLPLIWNLESGLVLSTYIIEQTGRQYKDPYPYTHVPPGTYKSSGEMWVLRLDWTGVDLTFV